MTITPRMRDALTGSRRWTRFVSIFGFVLSSFMLFLGLSALVGIGTDWRGLVFMVMIIAVAAVYFVPSLHLFRYSSHLATYVEGGGSEALEAAEIEHFHCFRFLGIAVLVLVVIYPVLALTLFLSGALPW